MGRKLTTQEAADMLKVKASTVVARIKRGELKAVYAGKRYVVDESDLAAYLGAPDETASLNADIAQLEHDKKVTDLKLAISEGELKLAENEARKKGIADILQQQQDNLAFKAQMDKRAE